MKVRKEVYLVRSQKSEVFKKTTGVPVSQIDIGELYSKKEEYRSSLVFVENDPVFREKISEIVLINPGVHIILYYRERVDPERLIEFMKAGILESVCLERKEEVKDLIRRYRKESHLLQLNYYNNLMKKFQNVGIITRSLRMAELFSKIDKIADTNATVLIYGESGTGKELVARSIHHFSQRRPNRFVAVNTGAIPENLLEDELFGHKKGAFTSASSERQGKFEHASKGSIFLDEISAMPLNLQVKLLRVLQEKELEKIGDNRTIKIDVRVIAASNTDLKELVEKKEFREDLYYRLNVIPLCLPPLRMRKKDISILANYFLKKYCRINNVTQKSFSINTLKKLQEYKWPGNIRELENIVERMLLLHQDKRVLMPEDIPEEISRARGDIRVEEESVTTHEELPEEGIYLKEVLNNIEKKLILKSLKRTEGNKKQAAELLNIKRTTLIEKIKKYQDESVQ